MSFTKTKIFNIALSDLLLSEEVINAETDKGNEVKVLNRFYDIALESTIQDLDLDSLSQPILLELVEELENHAWAFAYKYPTNCAFLRRIQSPAVTDNIETHISKVTGIHNGQKVIFTNEYAATGDCIPNDIPLETLSPSAGLAVAHALAILCAPLLVGKGAKALRKEIKEEYVMAKLSAQEKDSLENFNYESPETRSEFVQARIS